MQNRKSITTGSEPKSGVAECNRMTPPHSVLYIIFSSEIQIEHTKQTPEIPSQGDRNLQNSKPGVDQNNPKLQPLKSLHNMQTLYRKPQCWKKAVNKLKTKKTALALFSEKRNLHNLIFLLELQERHTTLICLPCETR
jgi:hypothetical protein